MIRVEINDESVEFDGDPAMPLLWFLRDARGLTGTKYGCGAGLCGACTVHVDGRAQRSCLVPMRSLDGRSVTTIEHLGRKRLHAVQRAWVELDVAQCGYCQAGQIMAVVDLLGRHPAPTDEQIDRMQTNLCRCGTYTRLRKAIHRAAEIAREEA